MKRDIRVSIFVLICSQAFLVMFAGCKSPTYPTELSATGFLSNYSGLKPISDTSYRYVNPKYNLGNYATFIIDPVEVIFSEQAKSMVKNWDDLEQLKGYMRRTFKRQLIGRYNPTATRPGPGVARIRIALTNVERSEPFKLGSVSMEMELIDTQTGEQIGALVESQEKGVPFHGYDPWSGAKAIMDDWAKRFYDRLEEARGY
jgi:hypothetical protein